jgi:hypothetical protein
MVTVDDLLAVVVPCVQFVVAGDDLGLSVSVDIADGG